MNILNVMERIAQIEDDYFTLLEQELEQLDETKGSMTPSIPRGKERRKVVRQFKRYGNTFKRQFRCMSGPRKGRLVVNPQKCGMRKDPRKVRQGKMSARRRKGERVRKTKLAKRRAPSKMVQRLNKRLRGDLG
jgi:hypothetical protein